MSKCAYELLPSVVVVIISITLSGNHRRPGRFRLAEAEDLLIVQCRFVRFSAIRCCKNAKQYSGLYRFRNFPYSIAYVYFFFLTPRPYATGVNTTFFFFTPSKNDPISNKCVYFEPGTWIKWYYYNLHFRTQEYWYYFDPPACVFACYFAYVICLR